MDFKDLTDQAKQLPGALAILTLVALGVPRSKPTGASQAHRDAQAVWVSWSPQGVWGP